MNSKLLNMRLDRIESQKSSLSAEDMLILVTDDQANLNRGFFSRLFTVNVPEKWNFYYANSDQIGISLRFIDFIENTLIHHYSSHAKGYAWFEQCLLFRLKYQATINISQVVNKELKKIEQCKNRQLRRDILKILFDKLPNASTTCALASACKADQLYNDAVIIFELYFSQYTYFEEVYFDYIETLILRSNKYYKREQGEFSDLEYALYLLVSMQSIVNKVRHQYNIEQILQLTLPQKILASRAELTNIFADMGRGLNSFSKGLGNVFGGRESEIPQSKGVIASAPKLLNNLEIVSHLEKNKKAQKELEKILGDKGSHLSIGLSATVYSLGLIWNYAHIEPSVLGALTFASKGNPESFNTLQDVSASTLGSADAMNRLSGYVAEQQVAYNLQAQGHIVEFPTTANQAGYDLIVDGNPIQVKCSMDANYVLHHFDKYPDIPVIVNSELAEKLGDHPLVMIDPLLSYTSVQESTNTSLDYISEFDGIADVLPIPIFTVAFAAYRNYGELNAGKINSHKYLENVGKETAVVAGGALAGKMIGGAIGALGGPVGIAIGGGLGAYIGGVAGSTGANTLNREALCNQRDVVVELLIQFATWFNTSLLSYRLKVLERQLNAFERNLIANNQHIILAGVLFSYQYETYSRASQLYDWLSSKLSLGNEMEKVQAGWVALEESSNFMSVELKPKIDEINRQLEIYRQLANPDTGVASVPQLKLA